MIQSLSLANKSAVKKLKDASHKLDKKIEDLTDKNKTLADIKLRKLAEEKELRSKNQKIEKKLKVIREKEAEICMGKRNLAKAKVVQNNNSIVDEVDLETIIEKNAAQLESIFCTHSPQC